jgi:hypothetical protein
MANGLGMSIAAADVSSLVVIPALELLAAAGIPYSDKAYHLIMGTAAAESAMGGVLVEEGGGPGVGMFMATLSLAPNIMARCSPTIRAAVAKVGEVTNGGQVASNLTLAAMLARCWYWVDPRPLPADTVSALGGYWKLIYNTAAGAGDATHWATSWKLTGISLPA